MFESFGVVLRLLLEIVGATAVPQPGAAAFAVLAVTALALVAVMLTAFEGTLHARGTPPTPERGIDDSTRLAQSHPDAPGHSRPRAPGSAASAA
jgi:hypothetical protein